MTVDQLSYELGQLTTAVQSLRDELKDFKGKESLRHDAIDKKLDCLMAKENHRKGMLDHAKKQARIWGAILGAVVVTVIESIKHWVFGG